MLRNLAVSLSLANLCFIETWANLLDPAYRFHMKSLLSSNNFVAILVNVLLLTAVTWVALTLARPSSKVVSRRIGQFAFLLVLLIAFWGVFIQLLRLFPFPYRTVVLFFCFTVAVIVLTLWHSYLRYLLSAGATIALVLFPFVPVTFLQVGWSLRRADSTVAFSDKALAPSSATGKTAASRVLWFVFDEMDQRMTFSERPPTVALPEIDRLRSQAIYASNAYPPASETLMSMPALLSGKLISNVKLLHANELMITFAGAKDAVPWGTQPNVFSKAREADFHTAVVGWYLPYCRMIGDSLTTCSWQMLQHWDDQGKTVSNFMLKQIKPLIGRIPFAGSLGLTRKLMTDGHARLALAREKHMGAYLTIFEDAKKVATNPDLDLILVHWPVPHPPGIYDRSKDDFALDEGSSYLDNLELMDRTLGEIRRAMEGYGIWENTTVLITSDHWWRTDFWSPHPMWTSEEAAFANGKDHRVPFLLRVAGQKEAITYEPAFNTVLTHDLLLALLRGEVSTPNSIVSWIDRHRSIAGSPYSDN